MQNLVMILLYIVWIVSMMIHVRWLGTMEPRRVGVGFYTAVTLCCLGEFFYNVLRYGNIASGVGLFLSLGLPIAGVMMLVKMLPLLGTKKCPTWCAAVVAVLVCAALLTSVFGVMLNDAYTLPAYVIRILIYLVSFCGSAFRVWKNFHSK